MLSEAWITPQYVGESPQCTWKHYAVFAVTVKKYLIGLTGNIATGKSAVLRMLKRLGAKVIDADALVHRLMAKGTPVWQAVMLS